MAADNGIAPKDELREIPLIRIGPSPENARKHFDEEELQKLAASIREEGVIEPILVQPFAGAGEKETFEILAGERRWRASKLAGRETIPCIIRRGLSAERAAVIGLIENLQRSDLKFEEACSGTAALVKLLQAQLDEQPDAEGRSALDIAAERTGQSKAWVSRHATVLSLSEEVRTLVAKGYVDSVDVAHDLQKLQNMNKDAFDGIVSCYFPDPYYDPEVDGPDEDQHNESRRPTRARVRECIRHIEEDIEWDRKRAAAAEAEKAANAGKPKKSAEDPISKSREKLKKLNPQLIEMRAAILLAACKVSGIKSTGDHDSALRVWPDHVSEWSSSIPSSAGKAEFNVKVESDLEGAAVLAKALRLDKPKITISLPENLTFEAARKIQAVIGSPLKIHYLVSALGADFCKALGISEPASEKSDSKGKQSVKKTLVKKVATKTVSAAKKAAPKPKAKAAAKKKG